MESGDETVEDDQFYGEITLRFDVQNIQVVQIRAVTYQKKWTCVNRYRIKDKVTILQLECSEI